MTTAGAAEIVAHDVGVGYGSGGVLGVSDEPVGVRGRGRKAGQYCDDALHSCISPHHGVDIGHGAGRPTLTEKLMVLGLDGQNVPINERAGLGVRFSALLPGYEGLGEGVAGRAQGRSIGGELGPGGRSAG